VARQATNSGAAVSAAYPSSVYTLREIKSGSRQHLAGYTPLTEGGTVPNGAAAIPYTVELDQGIQQSGTLTIVSDGDTLAAVPYVQTPGANEAAVDYDLGWIKFPSSRAGETYSITYPPAGSRLNPGLINTIQKEIIATQTELDVVKVDIAALEAIPIVNPEYVYHVSPTGTAYSTVTAALAAATNAAVDKVILIHPGTYNESFTVTVAKTHLVGTDRFACAISDAVDSDDWTGFPSAVVDVQASNVTIQNLTITNTETVNNPMAAVRVGYHGSEPAITGFRAHNCDLNGSQDTIWMQDNVQGGVVENCRIIGTIDAGSNSGDNNTFKNCYVNSTDGGAAFWCGPKSPGGAQSSTNIINCTVGECGYAFIISNSVVTFVGNVYEQQTMTLASAPTTVAMYETPIGTPVNTSSDVFYANNAGFVLPTVLNSGAVNARPITQLVDGTAGESFLLNTDDAAPAGLFWTTDGVEVAQYDGADFLPAPVSAKSFTASGAEGFTGSGANLTNLPAAQLTGTVADARLSSNVPLKNAANTYTGVQTFSGATSQYVTGHLVQVGGASRVQYTTNATIIYSTASGAVQLQHNGAQTLLSNSSGVTLGASGTAISRYISATAALDFASIAANSIGTLTVTATGAAAGDSVHLGPPAAIEAGLMWSAFVSAADTVTIRLHNTTGSAIDPASATWRVSVIKH
jgi:hypothetical protein